MDNGSDPVCNIVKVVTQFQQAIATFESSPGSYAARNQGIAIAKGSILAFTDADCIPHRDWIEQGVAALLLTYPIHRSTQFALRSMVLLLVAQVANVVGFFWQHRTWIDTNHPCNQMAD